MDCVSVVVAAIALGGLGALLYPTAAQWFTAVNQAALLTQYTVGVDEQAEAENARLLADARVYNREVGGAALVAPSSNLPESVTSETGQVGGEDGAELPREPGSEVAYEDQLRIDGSEAIGRLVVPNAAIDLPIFHGTDDKTLATGVGHLEGTALPVGGEGLRPVLTAHRGLAEAKLFNHLDRVGVGDIFTVGAAGQTLTYRVIDTRVVKPDETESILPIAGRDLVTLVTCTPLGINSHRILVTGERVDGSAVDTVSPRGPGFPWWALGAGGGFATAGAYIWVSGRRKWPS